MTTTAAGGDNREPLRSIRLSDEKWDELERIAEWHGLIVRAVPSRGAAIRWLIENQAERDNGDGRRE